MRRQLLILYTSPPDREGDPLKHRLVLGEIGSRRELEIDCPYYLSKKIENPEQKYIRGVLPDEHDFIQTLLLSKECNLRIEEVEIQKAPEEDMFNFFQAVVTYTVGGRRLRYILDAASALFLASMSRCEIYAKEHIMRDFSYYSDKKEPLRISRQLNPPAKVKTHEELETELKEALSKENYEEAARIREALKKEKKE